MTGKTAVESRGGEGSWGIRRLGDVLRLDYGSSLPESERSKGTVPVMGSSGQIGTHSDRFVSGPGIVVGRKGSIGEVTWVSTDFWPIDTTYFVHTNDGLADLRWIFHVLQRENLKKLNRATGVPGLNRDDVYALRRPIPPRSEQQAIAAILDSIDDAIERTEEVITSAENLRQAMLQDLLNNGIPGWHTEWKDAPDIGRIPADWTVVRLGEVAEVQTGRAVNKANNLTSGVRLPYLSVVNVKDRYLDLTTVKTMQVPIHEVAKHSLKPGDVLFTEGGDADKLGRGCVWRGEIDPCLHQNHVFAVRPAEKLLPEYLSLFASSFRGKRYFLKAANQTTNLASVNSTQLRRMLIPLPLGAEQRQIQDLSEILEATEKAINSELTGLKNLKASVSDALLTGRIRVGGE